MAVVGWLLLLVAVALAARSVDAASDKYKNSWSVKIFGGADAAKSVAQRTGFSFVGPVKYFDDYYKFKRPELDEVSNVNGIAFTKQLMKINEVQWAGQEIYFRVDVFSLDEAGKMQRGAADADSKSAGEGSLRRTLRGLRTYTRRKKRNRGDSGASSSSAAPPPPPPTQGFPTWPPYRGPLPGMGPTSNIRLLSSKLSAYANQYSDPYWNRQWYLHDYRTVDGPVMDHNVVPLYRAGVTGVGVKIAVVDEGIDERHPDYLNNYMSDVSDDPTAESETKAAASQHGTMSAGVISMVANNRICGVGVAHGAKFASLSIMKGQQVTTSATVATAYMYGRGTFDIFCNAWTRTTEGKFLRGQIHMENEAIRKSISEGRRGKGAIFVMSAGNFKHDGDSCAFSGIANNPHNILVGAANQNGRPGYYSDPCANLFVTAYSKGLPNKEGVVATMVNGECTNGYGGTSAAAAIVSGIIALILQVNPNLTYRDVQHLITMSAEVAPLADNPGTWRRNRAGFWVSQEFGFGLMNAQNMANLARSWRKVPELQTSERLYAFNTNSQFRFGDVLNVGLDTGNADGLVFLERISVTFSIYYPGPRGYLSISLVSPQGTESQLIAPRTADVSSEGYNNWMVTSSHLWGEKPSGVWQLRIQTTLSNNVVGFLGSVNIKMYGMKTKPVHYSGTRDNYANFRLA